MEEMYVYVVCGPRRYLDRLHVSLELLRQRTTRKIVVVTDVARNEIPVRHDRVIDVPVSSAYPDHEAAILLKTSLHRILPPGNRYVYLDTDVLPMNGADGIWAGYVPPAMFAKDHCTLDEFSPHALHCGCLADWGSGRETLGALTQRFKTDFAKHEKNYIRFQNIKETIARTGQAWRTLADRSAGARIRACLTRPRQYLLWWALLTDGVIWIKRKGFYDMALRRINREQFFNLKDYVEYYTDLRYAENTWVTARGIPLSERVRCTHLREAVAELSGQKVEAGWQHWNGGVFVFGDESVTFMDEWHNLTRRILEDKTWKTRDQGTLLAAAWVCGLQNHPRLAVCWNTIIDSGNDGYVMHGEKISVPYAPEAGSYVPGFMHYLDRFGDENDACWIWGMEQTKNADEEGNR